MSKRASSLGTDMTVLSMMITKDFEFFPCGDLTEIGKRGINMNGGQKQRFQIARTVCEDTDIYFA